MSIKIASLQMNVITDKIKCIKYLENMLQKPELRGVDMLTLPEMFCSPYQSSAFPEYAEPEGSGVYKPKEPTFKTPEAPTTTPLGETNTAFPL